MLNKLWGAMIITGVVWGILSGNGSGTAQAFIDGSRDAVSLAVTMAGIMAFWSGIMKIAEKAGVVSALTNLLMPINRALFPTVPKNHKAMKWISANFAANFFGLGWAATPLGLEAMKELHKLNDKKNTATDAMCMFLIINISSIQLLSINIIAYRTQYLSQNPWEVVLPTIIATAVSTMAGIISAKAYAAGGRKWKY